jgi:2-dehydro-3-deoxyphosphooctonate aldolase (KDO 8-P synthase)
MNDLWKQITTSGKPLLVAGPCVAESVDLCMEVAEAVAEAAAASGWLYVFKASYDKANRSHRDSARGPGFERGLDILEAVKSRTGLPICADFHTPDQVEEAARVADMLQVPALLSRQTDMLEAAARTGAVVNIKKGQFMSPADALCAAEKAVNGDLPPQVVLTERGTFFGYERMVVDMPGIGKMKWCDCPDNPPRPVILDITHSTAGQGSPMARRRASFMLAFAGMASGADGLFLEAHPNPQLAPCDGAAMLQLGMVKELLRVATAVHNAVKGTI